MSDWLDQPFSEMETPLGHPPRRTVLRDVPILLAGILRQRMPEPRAQGPIQEYTSADEGCVCDKWEKGEYKWEPGEDE